MSGFDGGLYGAKVPMPPVRFRWLKALANRIALWWSTPRPLRSRPIDVHVHPLNCYHSGTVHNHHIHQVEHFHRVALDARQFAFLVEELRRGRPADEPPVSAPQQESASEESDQ